MVSFWLVWSVGAIAQPIGSSDQALTAGRGSAEHVGRAGPTGGALQGEDLEPLMIFEAHINWLGAVWGQDSFRSGFALGAHAWRLFSSQYAGDDRAGPPVPLAGRAWKCRTFLVLCSGTRAMGPAWRAGRRWTSGEQHRQGAPCWCS